MLEMLPPRNVYISDIVSVNKIKKHQGPIFRHHTKFVQLCEEHTDIVYWLCLTMKKALKETVPKRSTYQGRVEISN